MTYPSSRNIHRPPHISLPNRYYFISARTYYSLPFLKEKTAKEILKESFDKAVEKFCLDPVAWIILNEHYHWMFKSPPDNTLKGVTPESRSDKLQFVTPQERSDKLQFVKPFKIGRVIGYVHGRSSKLIRDFRREEAKKYVYDFTPQEFAIIKRRFAKHLGPEYVELEEERRKEFSRILESGSAEDLLEFTRKTDKIWYQYTDHIIKDKGDFYRHLNYTYQNSVKHGHVEDMFDYEFSSIHGAVERRGKDFVLECFSRHPIKDFNPDFEDW